MNSNYAGAPCAQLVGRASAGHAGMRQQPSSATRGGAEAKAATMKETETNGATEEDERGKLKGSEAGGISRHACARRRERLQLY